MEHLTQGFMKPPGFCPSCKDLIKAADKYGLSNLKIESEGWYVNYLKFAADNAVEILIYAAGMNCFLLKEAVVNFIVANANKVLATLGIKCTDKGKDLSQLSINKLQAYLDLVEKDFDGSKQMLVGRLKKLSRIQVGRF
jgi:hypothetical protein